jgi:diguanylate cyclase (GGDEF)-like protein/PAS domain S-box-containing protein
LSDGVLVDTLDASPDAVVLFTPGAKVVYANEAVTPVFGRTPEELVGTNVADLLHPEDVGSALASVDAFESQGVRARTAALMRFRWPDGTYVTLEVNGNPVDTDGRRLYSMFARRAEDRRIMAETVEMLTGELEVATALRLVYDLWRWPLDRALSALVWQDEDGCRHVLGDDLPDTLTGRATAADDPSPWGAAWRGEEVTGETADLPPALRAEAEERGLVAYRIHQVPHDGPERVLVTLWATESSHPIPVFEGRLEFISRLILVTLRFADQQRRLQHDAANDALTGLANRRTFFGAAPGEAASVAWSTAVLYIDLDAFKPINDRWGHAAGDLVLKEVARRLAASCRLGDTVARLGGDEFAVLCASCSADEARAIADRFLEAVGAPIDIGEMSVTVGASVGVALLPAAGEGPPPPLESVVSAADSALYEAKRQGGRRAVMVDVRV